MAWAASTPSRLTFDATACRESDGALSESTRQNRGRVFHVPLRLGGRRPSALCETPPVEGRVAWLTIAPVKALGLVHPEAIELGANGVSADRRFFLVDEDGRLYNGKRDGRLVRIRPDYDEAGETLILHFPDGTTVTAGTDCGEPGQVPLYDRVVATRDLGGPLADAISDYAGRALRLLRVDPPATAVDRGSEGAISLLSVAALRGLAAEADVAGSVDARRFRMLIGIDGIEAHAEDGWAGRAVQIGEAVVRPREPVGRCAVTTHDPDTGEPDLDTLRVIGGYRGEVPTNEPVPFGVWGRVEQPGRVALGDSVCVLP